MLINRSFRLTVLESCFLLSLFWNSWVNSFYLPGVAPKNFEHGEKIDLKVNKLTSHETQLPYNYYHLEFCQPKGGVKNYAENLGEFLSGDRIESSPYLLYMAQEDYCKILCQITLDEGSSKRFSELIGEGYHHNWIVDNLPAASLVETPDASTITSYVQGFPIGYQVDGATFLNNHAKIFIDYHTVQDQEPVLSRIVGFEVEPLSVQHSFKSSSASWDGEDLAQVPPLATCDSRSPLNPEAIKDPQTVQPGATVLFTYDVLFRPSDTHWASRWDIYLSMNHAVPNKVHWFSIMNSLLIVLFLSMMIGMILVRNLYRDIAQYNKVATDEEKAGDREETGWKLVHGDVFRPPAKFPLFFCVLMGTGVQLLVMTFFTIIFAAAGFLSPANRGSLLIAILLLFVTLASSAGFTSARLYKTFKGKQWQKCTLVTSCFFPGICFSVFLILNVTTASLGSTQAVPLFSLVALIVLWFGISVPMVFLGAYFGYRMNAIEYPTSTSNIPRQIPDQPWYLSVWCTSLVGGILPFGACFVELFFILSSVWMGQYYYVFGFLFIVYNILLVTCAEITMVLTYFQLCAENYHWWWRAFLTAGSTGIYVFAYCAIYFHNLEANMFVTYLLYFGYTFVLCLGIFAMTGCVGVFSSMWLNTKIYASVKVD